MEKIGRMNSDSNPEWQQTASSHAPDSGASQRHPLPQCCTRGPTGPADEPAVVFFDGVCGLCNWSVDFVLARDKSGIFRFAPLQGQTAAERLGTEAVQSLESVVMIDQSGVHCRSTAMVRMLWGLGRFWKCVGLLLWLVPRPLRDFCYWLVVRNRYYLFGRREMCRIPSVDERSRFLP